MGSNPNEDLIRRRAEATVVFKLALKANAKAFHRTLNRAPKGDGWVQCRNAPEGMMCRPGKVRESIELFQKAYAIFPDIVALHQIALSHEMMGEFAAARDHFLAMKEQAGREGIPAYVQAADLGLERTKP
jgi:hypothetical protein